MHLRFRALARRPGRPIALILATALVLPLAAAPVAAAPGSHGAKADFGAKATRTAKASRTTGRAAAAETATSKRKDATKHAALARPRAFAAGDAGSTAAPRTDGIRPATVAGPGLVSTRGFDGLDQEDAGGLEPPNPWVAVNATHVVQSTEGNIRVSSRAGQELATIASWSLFAVPDGYYATQTRIIWDAFHGRWVGSLMYSDFTTFADNHLVIAVSDGANPLGSWSSYDFGYGNYLPDSPAIASSSDKVVVTANEFPDGLTYAGSSVLSVPWSAILDGSDVDAGYAIESGRLEPQARSHHGHRRRRVGRLREQ